MNKKLFRVVMYALSLGMVITSFRYNVFSLIFVLISYNKDTENIIDVTIYGNSNRILIYFCKMMPFFIIIFINFVIKFFASD